MGRVKETNYTSLPVLKVDAIDSYKLCMYVVVPRATTKGTIQSNTLKILDRSKRLFNQK